MDDFAPIFMNSQLAGVIDYSFSRAGSMEEDDISNYLRMPILLKSPSVIVDTVMWLDHIVTDLDPGESANLAVVNALDNSAEKHTKSTAPPTAKELQAWVDEYEYAYWLGYIYRCECHMHDESSRMVYGAFNESFMRDFYEKLTLDEDASIVECAPEICRRLDALLVGKLWKKKKE